MGKTGKPDREVDVRTGKILARARTYDVPAEMAAIHYSSSPTALRSSRTVLNISGVAVKMHRVAPDSYPKRWRAVGCSISRKVVERYEVHLFYLSVEKCERYFLIDRASLHAALKGREKATVYLPFREARRKGGLAPSIDWERFEDNWQIIKTVAEKRIRGYA